MQVFFRSDLTCQIECHDQHPLVLLYLSMLLLHEITLQTNEIHGCY